MNQPICPIHNNPMKWKEGGISKAGRKYQGFWSCGKKNPDNSWCNYKPPAETPVADNAMKFGQSLDNMNNADEKKIREASILLQAMLKSCMEAGIPAVEAKNIALELAQFVEDKVGQRVTMGRWAITKSVSVPQEEINVDDIPF